MKKKKKKSLHKKLNTLHREFPTAPRHTVLPMHSHEAQEVKCSFPLNVCKASTRSTKDTIIKEKVNNLQIHRRELQSIFFQLTEDNTCISRLKLQQKILNTRKTIQLSSRIKCLRRCEISKQYFTPETVGRTI